MSKLPAPVRSKLPSLGLTRQASVACRSSPRLNKRRASDEENLASPSKRSELMNNDLQGSTRGFQAPTSRAPVRNKLRRSTSVTNVAFAGGLARSKLGGGFLNGRPSISTSSLSLPPNRPSMPASSANRRPGTNITSRVNNTRPNVTKPDPKPLARSNSVRVSPSLNKEKVEANGAKGKPKRAGWDLKGKLEDAQDMVRTAQMTKATLEKKLKENVEKLQICERERDEYMKDMEQNKRFYEETQIQLEECEKTLKTTKDEFYEERKKLEREIDHLEFTKRTIERQNKSLETEVSSKIEEIANSKTTISRLTSSLNEKEESLSTMKTLLDYTTVERDRFQKELKEALESINRLTDSLHEGETMRRKLHNTIQELKGNIRVFCRVRPLLGPELVKNGNCDVTPHISVCDEKTIEILKGGNGNSSTMSGLKGRSGSNAEFTFDRVFGMTTTQSDVFEEISQLVQSALDGYNVCVFAYGQTGSGKTYTMEGGKDSDNEGMIPRTVRTIFASMDSLKEKGWDYKFEVSFLEIYNETIRDLLASPSEAKNLSYDIKLVDSKSNETCVTNLKIMDVSNAEDVVHYLNVAQQHRAVAATNMNERSSRSHSVFRLKLTGSNVKTSETCEGTLNLVDLAGSERLKESGSEGARLTETQNINRSLSNLGNVTMALAQKQSHIPYRNSKLTHLLQNSLGGNSKTLMFVNVSPVDSCMNETLNSLRFAAKVNQCHIGTATKQAKK